jgi:hypothetical protein
MRLDRIFQYTPEMVDPRLLEAQATDRLAEVIEKPVFGIYTFPLLTPAYCADLIEVCEATGRFAVSRGATYAVPELRFTLVSKLLMQAYMKLCTAHVLHVIDHLWGLADHFDVVRVPFVCKYTMDTVQHMDRHHDAHATLSLSVNLNHGYEGGGLYFPAWDYNAREVPVGHCILFHSMLSHEHEALPITAGTRYSLVGWLSSTKAEVSADEAWVLRPNG